MLKFLRHLFPRSGDSLAYERARELARSAQRNANDFARLNAALEREIADHKRAELELKNERKLFLALTDNLPERIYFKDTQSRFQRISKAHLELFGLKNPNEVLGKTDFNFFAEEHARQAFEDEMRVMQTGQPITLEEKETWPDGHVSWVLTTKMPWRDDHGKIIGTFGISHDITARKQMEDELRQARTELEARVQQRTQELQKANAGLESANSALQAAYIALLLRVTEREQAYQKLETSSKEAANLKAALDEHAIVVITDLQGNITSVNDKFCAISHYSREELLRRNHHTLVSPEFYSREFIRNLWATVGEGRAWKGELKNRDKNGSIYWVESSIVPDFNPEGNPCQAVAISTDITDLKTAEVVLRKTLQDKEAELDKIQRYLKDNI